MNPRSWRPPRFLIAPVVLLFLLGGFAPFPATNPAAGNLGFHPLIQLVRPGPRASPRIPTQPPTDAQCRAAPPFINCYSPQEMQNAYGEASLLAAGNTGAGQTIVIIDSYGSPTIKQDLHTFDVGYNLPDPPSFRVLAPLGTVPWDPNNATMLNWGFETTLDVEWAHAMAPGGASSS